MTLQQCLFGYQDGHRLIASSERLSEDVISALILQSDLTPGLRLSSSEGYWTGMPLSKEKTYALMRTWLAPEMPRPGCVWSHVVFIKFTDIGRFADLSLLIPQFIRPSLSAGFESYKMPASVFLDQEGSVQENQAAVLSITKAQQIVRALYSGAEAEAERIFAPLGSLDTEIFAVWSQQWPRLRRTFSFRTANAFSETTPTKAKFDLMIYINESSSSEDKNETALALWENACVADLSVAGGTEFRKFLWRYGADIRYGRKRFKFLAEIFISTRVVQLNGGPLRSVLSRLVLELPSVEDGKVLKQDFLRQSTYSMLPSTDGLDILAFHISDPNAEKLPAPMVPVEQILESQTDRLDEVLLIANAALQRTSEIGDRFIACLATFISSEDLFFNQNSNRNLRQRLVFLKPSLLDFENLNHLSPEELISLLDSVPTDDIELMTRLLPRLVLVDSREMAEKLTERAAESVLSAMFGCITKASSVAECRVAYPWIQAARQYPNLIIQGGFIERSKSTSELSLIAHMLEYTTPLTLSVGPIPWARALSHAQDDLRGLDRMKFLAFLIKLALSSPTKGCEPIFEISFEAIHNDLQLSRLGWEQTSQLQEYLPRLGWLTNWDISLRLRLATVSAYVDENFDHKSFLRLTTNQKLFEQLVFLLHETKKGQKYAKKFR